MARKIRHLFAIPMLFAVALTASGCAGGGDFKLPKMRDINPFKKPETKLPGKRVPVMGLRETGSVQLAATGAPVQLPPQQANDSWTQPGGPSSNAPGHLSLAGGLKTVWSASAGNGSSNYGKLTASPVIGNGRIFTIDARGYVSAFTAGGGKRIWRTGLTPQNEKDVEGYGGGIAYSAGRVFAATGFGTVVALDASSGKQLWTKKVGGPVRSSPTAADGIVIAVNNSGRTYGINAEDGSERWVFRGLPQRSSILTNASPAITNGKAVIPYASGDVVALDLATGAPAWTETLARSRVRTSLATMSDASRPVVAGDIMFAVGHSGRMIATSMSSGERLWTKTVRGTQPPAVAGNTVYVVDVDGRLQALQKSDGGTRWALKLPKAKTWSGPVLAGNKLWLVSNTGQLVGVDPAQGRVVSQRSLSTPVYIAPIVAANRMYVLTDKASLLALN